MATAIGLLEVELLIPGSGSLKDKRRVLRSIKDRLRGKFNLSIAEVKYQELHARSHLGIVTICNDRSEAEQRLNKAFELIDSQSGVQVIDHQIKWL